VVAPEHHDRVVRQPQPVEGVEDAAELRVHERDRRVVRRDRLLQLRLRHTPVRRLRPQCRGRNVRGVVGRVLRQFHLRRGVQVEILLRRDVGGVGAEEADREEKRLPPLLLQQLDRLRRDHAVGLLLVGPV
jgi:hypothetical protein